MSPNCFKDCGIARRCKLFLGAELERGTMVQEDLSVRPPVERHTELAAATCKLSLRNEITVVPCAKA